MRRDSKGIKKPGIIRYIFILSFSVVMLLTLIFNHQPGHAATGVIDPNGDSVVESNWSATPAPPYYTTIDDGTRQPTIPNTSDFISIQNNKADTALFHMSTLTNVLSVSSITLWAYHNDGSNGTVYATLYDSNETGNIFGTEQAFAPRTSAGWNSVTFNGLALDGGELNGLRISFRTTKGPGGVSTVSIYSIYAIVTYSASILSVDIVNGSGNSVALPSVILGSITSKTECQSSSGTLGTSMEKIRVNNTTPNGSWTLTMAATGGATAFWSNATNSYDFNDGAGASAGCSDGADADSLAGQLTIDPSVGTITPQLLCSPAGTSKGALTAYTQGVTDNITLFSASGSQVSCYYDLIGVSLSQQIPSETPASASPYTINMTLTIIAN